MLIYIIAFIFSFFTLHSADLGTIRGVSPSEAGSRGAGFRDSQGVTKTLREEERHLWLEEVNSPETKRWLEKRANEAENYFEKEDVEPIRESLQRLSQYEKIEFPKDPIYNPFFLEREKNQPQAALYKIDEEGNKKLLVDPKQFSKDGTVAISSYRADPEQKILAYGLLLAGSDQQEWRFLDLCTGKECADVLKSAANVEWDPRGQGVYYLSRKADPKSYGKLHFRSLEGSDEILSDLSFISFEIVDNRFLLLYSWGQVLQSMIDLTEETHTLRPVTENVARCNFIGTHKGRFAYISFKDAPKGKIVTLNPALDIVKESHALIDHASFTKSHIVVCYVKDAHHEIVLYDLEGHLETILPLPGYGEVKLCTSPDSSLFYFTYSDFTHPEILYSCDTENHTIQIEQAPKLPWDPEQYETKQLFYSSKDGTKIPLTLIHKKGIQLTGDNPTLLNGYGGFNIPVIPSFNLKLLGWLETGGVLAVAHIRGGGEYGEAWHEAGTKENKQNVFDDFTSAAEWLIEKGYTKPAKLAIYGRSNGGLLTAACITQRPELFKAAIVQAGVLDMLRFHLHTVGWLWIPEFGTPENREDYETLLSYSPYHNVQLGVKYPTTLVVTGDADDRVPPHHSYKFTAALQEVDDQTILRVYPNLGHKEGASYEQQITEATDFILFLKKELT